MLSAQAFDIFRTPRMDESIEKVEWRTYYPYVKSFRNNDTIEITINQSDVFEAMYDGLLLISGKVKKNGGGTVSFVNNAGAFMFSAISYEVNVKEIESVRDPGLVSTVRGYMCYTEEDSKHLVVAGWNYPNAPLLDSNEGYFNFLIPLKHLFNIFNDYRVVTCGKQTIRLTRSNNDNNCLLVTEKTTGSTTTTTTASIDIENVELKIKRIYPNNDIRLKLLKAIRADTPIVIPYRQWELHMKPSLPQGSTHDVWPIKTTSVMESPRYVIVCFQTDKQDKLTADPTYFDNVNITNIRLTLNGESFPNERMRLNFEKNDYAEAHYRYTEFFPSYMSRMQKRFLLDFKAFKARTLFVIDCSRRDESMKPSTVDVRLDIEASEGFPANTRAYCILVHDSIMEHLPLSEIVKNLS
ncbi:hypothetical protein NQ315_014595 [Exocentrus adspersus]|uniref:Double jelly roll-like domain-containing protein n=1 Tax=Exocentrus adspersus TaxID=1586481 RepID=A0AAV8VDV0_9CUCU|nr:hypothetical protein NQ315_005917 [Exocentrus adspersus]KAJ8916385.1 hypothetical protein NQ315_014595 [Exocentrus adspersus]